MHKSVSVVTTIEDDAKGSLSFLDFSSLPWIPRRIYWLQDLRKETSRGNHAHKNLSQLLILMNGSLKLDIYSGEDVETFELDKKSPQVLLYPGLWRVIRDATPDALLMVLADRPYDEDDYIRNWDDYLHWHQGREK